MSDDLTFASALDLRQRITSKDISPVELVEHALRQSSAVQPELNCFASMTEDVALGAARTAEQAIMNGHEPGLLHGLPVTVKDLIAMDGVRCTFGSCSMADNVAAEDAPSVERLKTQGACIVGKTTTSEFGCKAVGDNPLTGITRNPWDTGKTPGGSSAGAAASIAAGVTPFGLGTDGGGSVRIPGSLTGLFAIKPHFARVPVHPVSATTTLAHVGPMSRTVRDAALLLSAIAGFDARDPFAVAGPVPGFLAACDAPIEGLRIAWSPTYGYAKPDPEVLAICEEAAKTFEQLGCNVELVDDAIGDDPVQIWDAEFYTGVATRLKDVLKNDLELLDPAVAEILTLALERPLEDYYAQVFARYAFREKMRAFFDDFDLLLSPTLPVPAFDVSVDIPAGHEDANIVSWVRYTYPFNLTGTPAATIPAGFTAGGLPVGLQMVAGALREVDIFAAAASFEEARPWADKRPPG